MSLWKNLIFIYYNMKTNSINKNILFEIIYNKEVDTLDIIYKRLIKHEKIYELINKEESNWNILKIEYYWLIYNYNIKNKYMLTITTSWINVYYNFKNINCNKYSYLKLISEFEKMLNNRGIKYSKQFNY